MYNPLFSFTAAYYTPSKRLTYVNGVARQMTGESSIKEAIERVVKQETRRRIDSPIVIIRQIKAED